MRYSEFSRYLPKCAVDLRALDNRQGVFGLRAFSGSPALLACVVFLLMLRAPITCKLRGKSRPRAPVRAGHMAQPGGGQHQRRHSIGKGSHSSSSSSYFPQEVRAGYSFADTASARAERRNRTASLRSLRAPVPPPPPASFLSTSTQPDRPSAAPPCGLPGA